MITNLISEKYKEYSIYATEKNKEFLKLSHNIIDNTYKIIYKFKDTERNFVASIEINGKIYILKSPKAETVIPMRKIQTSFKNGEALETLINMAEHEKNGIDFFITPLAVIVKKGIFIKESFILVEFIEGEKPRTLEFIDEIVKITNKMHSLGIYHGDLNASNFIRTPSGIKVIDTQGRKDSFSNFKRAYDYLTFKHDLLPNELGYDIDSNFYVEKNRIGYFFALLIKGFKYIPIIKKIRNFKKNLRNKGWKI